MAWTIRGNPKTVFSDPQHGPQYLRLMLAMNVLDTLHRPLLETMKEGYEARFSAAAMTGDRMVLLGLVYSALSEALDAYGALRGNVEALATRADPGLATHILLLRTVCHKDQNDKSTFLNRIAGRVRNEVGFHWNTSAIQRAMDRFASCDEVLFRQDTTTTRGHLARFPYADGVMAAVMVRVADDQDSSANRTAALKEAMDVTTAFFAVVEAALARFMLDAGCRRVEV